jgi:hypothetical protein
MQPCGVGRQSARRWRGGWAATDIEAMVRMVVEVIGLFMSRQVK